MLAFSLTATEAVPIRISQVLPGLALALLETALERSQTEDDGALSRWLLAEFNRG